ncbi:hypothetical protein [Filimonas effusa]|uniref:Uncharacterized protein n=1 Tax=Filimonas effusa TaxID=2508721 RepID=A0A4Q1DD67_9BACT|nr:hypothetical protein [Filimonas effusa]RXK87330.1 hypothetical protein ESB13_11290 [Filimonas effusa]
MLNIDITKLARLTQQDLIRLLEIDRSYNVTISIPKTPCKTDGGLAKCIREYVCALYFLYQLRTATNHVNYVIPAFNTAHRFKFKADRPLAKPLAQLLTKAAAFYSGTDETAIDNYLKDAFSLWAAIRNKQLWFHCPNITEFIKQLEDRAHQLVTAAKTNAPAPKTKVKVVPM